MKTITAIFLAVFLISCQGNKEKCNLQTDEKKQELMIVGKTQIEDLKSEPFDKWYKKEYLEYNVDNILKGKEELFKDVEIKIVLATWCGDCRREVPRFIKIVNFVKYPKQKIEIISVDRNKKAGNINIENLNIEKVPTFIFYRKGIEIGRIIETPDQSLEKDCLEILKK